MATSFSDLTRVFGRIGLLSFGGPAAQIALMHKELVATRAWLSEAEFLRALSFCMLLPGPEAMQLATYAGWKQRGILGGLIGGGLFVLPGAIVIAVLALVYAHYGDLGWIQGLFVGVKATVVIIVIEALIKLSKRALVSRKHVAIALGAFIALFVFALPFPVVIGVAAILGAVGTSAQAQPLPDNMPASLPWQRSSMMIIIGAVIWSLPLLAAWAYDASLMRDIGLFFSKLAVVTFGGAYAVLAYMTQEVVTAFGWLSTDQMMDALGLAETTPGPLILVTQFVGMMAGFADGGTGTALLAGGITLWVTFVPCFIWIFAGAPLIDWLEGRPKLTGAMAAITAAVVGVIANLSLWFAMHVFFADVTTWTSGYVTMTVPYINSLQILPVMLALLAGYLLIRRRANLIIVLCLCGIIALMATTCCQPLLSALESYMLGTK